MKKVQRQQIKKENKKILFGTTELFKKHTNNISNKVLGIRADSMAELVNTLDMWIMV